MTLTGKEFSTKKMPTWCPGCGDFGIWAALKKALVELGYQGNDVAFVYGIGCHGNMYDTMKVNNFEGLHGRPLPVACGIRLANHQLPVFAISGDGDALGEGGNHFIHAARRNFNITYLIHDNQIYALTTGQTSPTTALGLKTKSNPGGSLDYPFNPLTLALAAGATFVARGFAGDIDHLCELIKAAHQHKGFSVLDILQPCVTFNPHSSYTFYREHIYKLTDEYQTNDKIAAFTKTLEWEMTGKIPIGIFYQEQKPTYEDEVEQIKNTPLIELGLSEAIQIENLMADFI
ncbi:2-oxoacid:ferredoxin oxidoreductase subunit beta [Candidatus Microgenomates bacterium]|nr:2-oxoacid:ferredoxin oxidoreductase subunit beta [Candidatus Microgenomates bacterium]